MLKAKVFAGTLLAAGLACPCGARPFDKPPAAQSEKAQESWRQEFDDLCSKTQDAMTLSEDQLSDFIRRCDALAPQIDKLDDSRKKVYSSRLRMCRGLYAYVLDSKKSQK
jgi:hypothetical protein